MVLEPKEITISQIPGFIKDAFELMKRRIGSYVILSILSILIFMLIGNELLFIDILFALIPFVIGSLIAKSADDSENVMLTITRNSSFASWKNSYAVLIAVFGAFFLLIAISFLIIVGISSIAELILGPTPSGNLPIINEGEKSATQELSIFPVGSRSFSILDLIFTLNVTLPGFTMLFFIMRAPLKEGIRLTIDALSLNTKPLIILMIGSNVVTIFIVDKIGIFYFLMLPLITALNYIIYRAIYTDRNKNQESKESSKIQDFINGAVSSPKTSATT